MPLPVKNDQISRPSMRDEVYNKLLNWIMEGVLRPGEKIVDKDLAEHLGVSRTPVREALRRLEDKELVESAANRWTRVSEIPSKEPEMIYPIIWTLEKLALATAMDNMIDDDFVKMDHANNALAIAIENNDPVAASHADADFHGVFIECSQNFCLIKILEDLKIRYRRLEVNYFEDIAYEQSSVEEHNRLICALRNRDVALAEEILHSNWEKSLERTRTVENRLDIPNR